MSESDVSAKSDETIFGLEETEKLEDRKVFMTVHACKSNDAAKQFALSQMS